MSSPQRFVGNHRNLIAAATLTPSAVQAVSNAVVETPLARGGTAQMKISGSYSGTDDAVYDFEVVDDTADTKLISTPIFTGAGSESLAGISVSTAAQQTFTLECSVAGGKALAAKIEIEGVNVIARASGTSGNGIHIAVDESGLTYDATSFSLIADLKKGAGSDSAPLDGAEFDWQTVTVGADNVIPDDAKRLVFEGDESNVYVQFKKFAAGKWQYFLIPAAQNDYPAGTKIKFVSGSRTVTITDGTTTDTLASIVTVFDFLAAVKTQSVLCDVDGVVADDRTPSGQSAREINLHTIARHGYSSGSGSKAATGFVSVTVEDDANTELVTAECIAVDPHLDPNAFVGHEAWSLKGSVSGDLGVLYSGVAFSGDKFGLTIPIKRPITSGNGAATISIVSFTRGSADAPNVVPCFSGEVGPNAKDGTITLVYTARPGTDCDCGGMLVPELDTACLGGGDAEGSAMSYSPDAQTRINDLYDWVSDLAGTVTRYRSGYADDGVPDGLTSVSGALFNGSLSTTVGNKTYSVATATPDSAVPGSVDLPTNNTLESTGYADVGLPGDFTSLIDIYDDRLQKIDAVADPVLKAAGLGAWDDAVDALKTDLDDTELASLGNRLASVASRKYDLMLRRALVAGGISPGKSSASNQSGDGCWQDYGDAFYWTVSGEDGGYAPAFTNHPYWSARKNGSGAIFSTKEFAFIINVACQERLVEGDTITIQIGNTAGLATYQVGDILSVPIIAAQDLFLTGGRASDRVQTWLLNGSVAGAFVPYTFDPDAPTAYASGGVAFQLVMGGIDPAQGDKFQWVVEGGHYRWRKDGGAWSASAPIPDAVTSFDSGLSFQFVRGVNPSFVAADLFTFTAYQQWKAENVKRPTRDPWFPGASSATLDADINVDSPPTPPPISGFVVAFHTIPEGATILVHGGDTANVVDWTETLTWRAGTIYHEADPSTPRTGVWCQLEVTNAPGFAIGWFAVCVPDAMELTADATPKLGYRLERPDSASGLAQSGNFLGKTVNVDVEWSEGALTEADVVKLTALVDHVKSNNDEPFVFVPNVTRPDAFLAKIIDDEIPLPDIFGLQPSDGFARRQSARLTLQGMWDAA